MGDKTMGANLGVLTNVEVPVADLEAAIRWYQVRLGFDLHWRGEGQAFLALPGEGVRFFLVETADHVRLSFHSRTGVIHGVVDFYVADLSTSHAALRARGVEVGELPAGAFGFGFQDPDGNRFGVHRDRGSYEHRQQHPTA